MQLHELIEGQVTQVKSFSALDQKMQNRLMDMGLYEGATLSLIRKINKGKLILVEVDGVCLCMRQSTASAIEVNA